MTRLLALLATALSVVAAAAAPPSKKVAIVYPPTATDEPTRQLGLIMQESALAQLRGGIGNYELHAKQLTSMSKNEGLSFEPTNPAMVERATTNLGGSSGLASSLEVSEKGYLLKGLLVTLGQKPKTFTANLSTNAAKAYDEGSRQLYAWASGTKLEPKVNPESFSPPSVNDGAVIAYASCYSTLVKQPMGIDNPSLLDPEIVKAAVASCRQAVAADPGWAPPLAGLALALAIDGADAEATPIVNALKDDGDNLPLYWIARFWLVTRYQSPEAGKAVLIEATGFRPGFGLADMYLCELLLTLNQNDSGLKLCEATLTAMPKAVFPELRVGKALSRLGKYDEAIARTKAALSRDPLSRESKLQLASRYIDAGRLDEAIAVLEPISKEPGVRGETLLRLGYAYEEKQQLDLALPMYEQAIAAASAPTDWRTLGRAWYDVAVLRARAGNKAKALDALRESQLTGFQIRAVHPVLIDVVRELDRRSLKSTADAGTGPNLRPREVSLFPVDAFGDIDATPKTQPPADFINIKF